MKNGLNWQLWVSNLKRFWKKITNKKETNVIEKEEQSKNDSSQRNLIQYKVWRQNWIVFKFIVRLFFSDYVGVFIIIIFPILISIIYLMLFKYDVFKESLFGETTIPGITTVKIWFEFLIYTIGFSAFVYLAVSIADIKYTILFKKMVTGFTTKTSLLILFFILYFLLSVFVIFLKFAILAFYPSFINKVLANFNWGVFLLGMFLFILINLSLGMLFSSIKLGSKGILPITIISFFVFLFFAGLWVAPAGVEMLFLVKSKTDAWKFVEVSDAAKIWRMITFISPLQPSFKMIEAGTQGGDYAVASLIQQYSYSVPYENYVTSFIKPPPEFADNYLSNHYKAAEVKQLLIFDSFEDFKKEIITPEGFQKWENGVKNYVKIDYPNLDFDTADAEGSQGWAKSYVSDIKVGMQKVANFVKKNPDSVFLRLEEVANKNIFRWMWTFKRNSVYSGTSVPLIINLGWLFVLNGITWFLWKTNRVT